MRQNRGNMEHQMNLNPRPFKNIKAKTKTVEMRLYDKKRRLIKPNDTIVFTNLETKEQLKVLVLKMHVFKDFAELYKHFDKLVIGYEPEREAHPDDMLMYYSKEQIKEFGVVGIEIKVI